MREAYIIASDLHFNSHKRNRFDYYGECLDVIDKLHRITSEIQADKKNLISLDDMVDRGKTTPQLYDKVVQLIKLLIDPYDNTYIALGNHTKTYHIDNPLFSFIKSFDTDALIGWKGVPKSLTQGIQVLDRLIFDDMEFVFRPYGTNTDKITDKSGILFMHDDLYPPGAESLVPYVKHRYYGSIEHYDFVFNGHLHSIRTVWNNGQTQVHNLGSLLRTKSDEVLDTDLLRIIPVIYINNGKFETIELKEIILPPREVVYMELEYQKSKEVYLLKKERDIVKDYGKVLDFDGDPIKGVSEAVRAASNFRVSGLWNRIRSVVDE